MSRHFILELTAAQLKAVVAALQATGKADLAEEIRHNAEEDRL